MTDKTTDIVHATLDAEITSEDVLHAMTTGNFDHIEVMSQDPDEVARRIDARIIDATSLDQVLGNETVLHAQDYLNTPFQLIDVEWRNSDQGGLPFYCVLTICDQEGEVMPMTTGARSVMLKAAKIAAAGWLDQRPTVKIVKSDKPTEAGNYPLDLVAAPASF